MRCGGRRGVSTRSHMTSALGLEGVGEENAAQDRDADDNCDERADAARHADAGEVVLEVIYKRLPTPIVGCVVGTEPRVEAVLDYGLQEVRAGRDVEEPA